jgi:hypothetical protein
MLSAIGPRKSEVNWYFYALRHICRTVADEAKDQSAVDFIMGHMRGDMASVYRERIGNERLFPAADEKAAVIAKSAGNA